MSLETAAEAADAQREAVDGLDGLGAEQGEAEDAFERRDGLVQGGVDGDQLVLGDKDPVARQLADALGDLELVLPSGDLSMEERFHFLCGWQRTLYDGGWAGVSWPKEYGGRGLTPAHNAAWIEACAVAGVTTGRLAATGPIPAPASSTKPMRNVRSVARIATNPAPPRPSYSIRTGWLIGT